MAELVGELPSDSSDRLKILCDQNFVSYMVLSTKTPKHNTTLDKHGLIVIVTPENSFAKDNI